MTSILAEAGPTPNILENWNSATGHQSGDAAVLGRQGVWGAEKPFSLPVAGLEQEEHARGAASSVIWLRVQSFGFRVEGSGFGI